MGQAYLEGPDAAKRFESLAPTDIAAQPIGRIRYMQLLDENGGILDDLMVVRRVARRPGEDCLFLVVNAARKQADFAHIRRLLPGLRLQEIEDRALLALQGPKAAAVLARNWPGIERKPFMSFATTEADGDFGMGDYFSRSGYTGEDGLGARDTLRLEAGLCLYGHDIDENTTPVEAALSWSIPKRRREAGGFPGYDRVKAQLAQGPARRRVGIAIEGRAPAREGAEILSEAGAVIGRVTSGGFGPSVGAPIAMGYVQSEFAAPGTPLGLLVRDKRLAARVAALPFHPHAYYRGP